MYYFGPDSAEGDEKLLKYFHSTPQILRLVDPEESKLSSLVYSVRSGCGKTATVRWLSEETHDISCYYISAEQTKFDLSDPDITEADIILIAKTELCLGLCGRIAEDIEDDDRAAELKEISKPSWLKELGDIASHVNGLTLFGFGFNLDKKNRKKYLELLRERADYHVLCRKLSEIGKLFPFSVLFDNPEFIVSSGLDVKTYDNSLRLGAMLTALSELRNSGIGINVFVRDHVLKAVEQSYDNYRHFSSTIIGLEWTANDLMTLVENRMRVLIDKEWSTIFELSREHFSDFLFPRLINGPRDLISICNIAGRNSTGRITEQTMQRALGVLKSQQMTEIEKQYKAFWPNVSKLVSHLSPIAKEKFGEEQFSKTDFLSWIQEEWSKQNMMKNLRETPWINMATVSSKGLDEILYEVGCLGFIEDREQVYPWQGRSIEKFRFADSLFWNRLFY